MSKNNPIHKRDSSPSDLQHEIIRRVMEKEHAIEEKKDQEEKIAATIEALDLVSKLSKKEKKAIARQVVRDYAQQRTQRKKIRRIATMVAVAGGLIALLLFGYGYHRATVLDNTTFRMVFAHKVDKINEPLEAISETVLSSQLIYACVYWTGLPIGTHTYHYRLTDGSGAATLDGEMTFSNATTNHYTWTRYKPRMAVDQPGEWKFEVILDGIPMIETFLTVHPPDRDQSPKEKTIHR